MAVFADEVDQALLAEFAKIIFWFGHAVAVGEEDFAGMHFDRALVVCHVIEQAHDRSADFEPADGAIFADQDWRQVSAVAVGKVVGTSVVDSQEKRGVLLHRSAFVELMVEEAEQGSGRDLHTFRPRGKNSPYSR